MALSKNTIKFLKSLHLKKFRQKYNKFTAEGEKIVGELLLQTNYPVSEVFATGDWLQKNEQLLSKKSIPFQEINEQELKLISQLTTPNKVLAVVDTPRKQGTITWGKGWSLYLAGLQDPGNVGTILRIADWFAIDRVVAGPGTVELYNTKVLQSTMGAFLRVEWVEEKIESIKEQAPEVPLWAADMGGTDIFAADIPETGILIIGNEGKGVPDSLMEKVDQKIAIAAPKDGGAESLNAAVATGILCAAIRRK